MGTVQVLGFFTNFCICLYVSVLNWSLFQGWWFFWVNTPPQKSFWNSWLPWKGHKNWWQSYVLMVMRCCLSSSPLLTSPLLTTLLSSTHFSPNPYAPPQSMQVQVPAPCQYAHKMEGWWRLQSKERNQEDKKNSGRFIVRRYRIQNCNADPMEERHIQDEWGEGHIFISQRLLA